MKQSKTPTAAISERIAKNNFDLLRLLLAGTVCLVHTYELSGFQRLAAISTLLSSAVAVKAFFVVSGFLIFMSYERSSSLKSYFSKRARRIYPAYFVVVTVSAFGLFIASSASISEYFSVQWLRYLAANLAFLNFLQPTLPGVFEKNPIPAVNGALWTLKIEVMFYLTVPVIVYLCRRFSHIVILAGLYGASVVYTWFMAQLAASTGAGIYLELGRQLPGQLAYFMAGAFLYYFLPLFECRKTQFLVIAVGILVATRYVPLTFLEPLALAIVVLFFALFPFFGNFGKFGDFSYGVYIIHFPLIQLLVQSGWFADSNAWMFLVCAVMLTLGCAISMWHWVEKRFLFSNSHYLVVEQGHPTSAH